MISCNWVIRTLQLKPECVLLVYIPDIFGNRKCSSQSTNADQKSLETVFSISFCRQSGDKWQSKTLFLTIFDLLSSIVLTFSIAPLLLCFTYERKFYWDVEIGVTLCSRSLANCGHATVERNVRFGKTASNWF